MTLKATILKTFSVKSDNFWNSNITIFFIMMIPNYSCITEPLIVIVICGIWNKWNWVVRKIFVKGMTNTSTDLKLDLRNLWNFFVTIFVLKFLIPSEDIRRYPKYPGHPLYLPQYALGDRMFEACIFDKWQPKW